MRKFMKTLGLAAVVSLSPLSAVADALFLEKLAAAGVQLSSEQIEQVEAATSIEDIVALLISDSTDFQVIKDVVSAAVKAHPDKAAEIVSRAVLEVPAAASVIVGAAIAVVVEFDVGRQVAVVAIVKAAVNAAPDQVESVRLAAIAAAPAQEDAINAAIDITSQFEAPDSDVSPPSPST
jgi:hypothetical protein